MLQFGVSLWTTLAKARIVNYDRNCSFIVLATVITIVNYDRHFFIVQATDYISSDDGKTKWFRPFHQRCQISHAGNLVKLDHI
jgi:hypothetical protein